jgi:hypothetical protein
MDPYEGLNFQEKRLLNILYDAVHSIEGKRYYQRYEASVGIVFDALTNLMALVAINSSLQGLAYDYEVSTKGLDPTLYALQNGLCDFSAQEFSENTEVLAMLPETKIVYDWLKKNNLPGTELISNCLAAILESPPNLEHFLTALNLENKSARAKLDHIKEQSDKARLLKAEKLEANKLFTIKLNGMIVELSSVIHATGKDEQKENITLFQQAIERIEKDLLAGTIERSVFLEEAYLEIEKTAEKFEDKKKWLNGFLNILKFIANFCTGLIYDKKTNPHLFFELSTEKHELVRSFAEKIKGLGDDSVSNIEVPPSPT